MITKDDFTRVNSDVYGNPRCVIHYLSCCPERYKTWPIDASYKATCKLMNRIGGRKFHNKQYGGGIVFQSYSLSETISHIERLLKEEDGKR